MCLNRPGNSVHLRARPESRNQSHKQQASTTLTQSCSPSLTILGLPHCPTTHTKKAIFNIPNRLALTSPTHLPPSSPFPSSIPIPVPLDTNPPSPPFPPSNPSHPLLCPLPCLHFVNTPLQPPTSCHIYHIVHNLLHPARPPLPGTRIPETSTAANIAKHLLKGEVSSAQQ